MISGILLAAGMSRRFEDNKLLAELEAGTVIEYSFYRLLNSNVSEVIVVLGWQAVMIEKRLNDVLEKLYNERKKNEPEKKGKEMPVKYVYAPYYSYGQAHSLTTGLRKVDKKSEGALFYLADQPFIKIDTINSIVEYFENTSYEVVIPVFNDKRGNPTIFDQSMFPKLLRLSGDEGGKKLIKKADVGYMEVDDPEILFDIDNKEDFEKAKAKEK